MCQNADKMLKRKFSGNKKDQFLMHLTENAFDLLLG